MQEQDLHLISSYAGLLTLATASVYAGAFGSLKGPRREAKHAEGKDTEEDDEDEDEEIPDRISAEDAYLFPIIGSVVLVGLYLVVKVLGTDWINWALAHYFTVTGIASIWKCSIAISKHAVGKAYWNTFSKFKINASRNGEMLFSMSLKAPSIILFFPSLIPSILYAYLPGSKKSALITDLLALSFSHNALSILKLDSFRTGMILLAGLFLYDIWWVFGTEVMVKVATSLDIPIKILWPKSFLFATDKGFTMLGLGDIVIPGMFVALALRYDLGRSADKSPNVSFGKPYFNAAITAYAFGLATTMVVMHTFGAAQPALLYLSPACILSFLLTAISRGELKTALAWSDDPEPEKKGEDKASSKSEVRKGGPASEVNVEVGADQQLIADADDHPIVDGESGRNLRSRTKRGRKQ